METKRPSRISMEGMIFNANHALETALNPDNRGVNKELFQKCKGIVLLSIVHVGAIFTGHYGTGVIMAKNGEGQWSAPCAADITGLSMGALLGGKVDQVLVFIMGETDENIVDFAIRPQTRIGLDAAIAVGKLGREASVGLDLPDKGTVSVTFSKGAFVGLGLQMGTLSPSVAQNKRFYGGVSDASEILFKNSVTIPEDSQVPDLYKKLDLLAKGETWVPEAEDLDRSRHFLQLAEDSSKRFHIEQTSTRNLQVEKE